LVGLEDVFFRNGEGLRKTKIINYGQKSLGKQDIIINKYKNTVVFGLLKNKCFLLESINKERDRERKKGRRDTKRPLLG